MSRLITHTLYAVGVTWAVTMGITGVIWAVDHIRRRIR